MDIGNIIYVDAFGVMGAAFMLAYGAGKKAREFRVYFWEVMISLVFALVAVDTLMWWHG